MKTIMTTLVLIILTAFAKAQTTTTPETYTVTVTVDNARNDKGMMVFSLSTENQFMRTAPLKVVSVSIKDGLAVATFKEVPAGEYAVIVLQDLNDNKQMDFEVNGMPKESYGVSNNMMSYGPPTWAEAKFEVTKDTNLTIKI